MIPDFVKIQTRAILNAAIAVREGRRQPDREDHDPARRARERARRDARGSSRPRPRRVREAAGGIDVDYKFGTMIEVPRGRPDRRRDRAPRRVLQLRHQRPDPDDVRLQPRRRRGRLPAQVRRGRHPARSTRSRPSTTRVAGLMKIAVDKGRATRPDIELGICGEHGGDPESIDKCERIGLDYVSLLAVPRPGGAPCGGAGHARDGARQVAARLSPGATRADSSPAGLRSPSRGPATPPPASLRPRRDPT